MRNGYFSYDGNNICTEACQADKQMSYEDPGHAHNHQNRAWTRVQSKCLRNSSLPTGKTNILNKYNLNRYAAFTYSQRSPIVSSWYPIQLSTGRTDRLSWGNSLQVRSPTSLQKILSGHWKNDYGNYLPHSRRIVRLYGGYIAFWCNRAITAGRFTCKRSRSANQSMVGFLSFGLKLLNLRLNSERSSDILTRALLKLIVNYRILAKFTGTTSVTTTFTLWLYTFRM